MYARRRSSSILDLLDRARAFGGEGGRLRKAIGNRAKAAAGSGRMYPS